MIKVSTSLFMQTATRVFKNINLHLNFACKYQGLKKILVFSGDESGSHSRCGQWIPWNWESADVSHANISMWSNMHWNTSLVSLNNYYVRLYQTRPFISKVCSQLLTTEFLRTHCSDCTAAPYVYITRDMFRHTDTSISVHHVQGH